LAYLYAGQNSQSVIVSISATRTPGTGLALMGCPISLRAAAHPVLVSGYSLLSSADKE
jgi:hypothetical protein